jgi:hypothetical protein
MLVIAREPDDWVRQSRQCLADLAVPFEIWQPDQIAERLRRGDRRDAGDDAGWCPDACCHDRMGRRPGVIPFKAVALLV